MTLHLILLAKTVAGEQMLHDRIQNNLFTKIKRT